MSASTQVSTADLHARLDVYEEWRDRFIEEDREKLIQWKMEQRHTRSFIQWILRRKGTRFTREEATAFLADEEVRVSKFGPKFNFPSPWKMIELRWSQYTRMVDQLRSLANASSTGMVTIAVEYSWLFEKLDEERRSRAA